MAGTQLLGLILGTSSLQLVVVEVKFGFVEDSFAIHYLPGTHTKKAFPLPFLPLEFLIGLFQIEFKLN